ncbi:MAG: CPBP family intramembrane glutamic endopeptidase [Nitrosopumilaceae archaeon]
MQKYDKALQVLVIPYSALVSIIFGMMIISFPLGAYIVFNSDVGQEINFEYPLDDFHIFLGGISYEFPIPFELGDVFIILWCAYLVLFAMCTIGPKKNFIKSLFSLMSHSKADEKHNSMVTMITWFSILVIASIAVELVQQQGGIDIQPPQFTNDLKQFFDVTLAPIIEELGFRVMLIGLPLFAIFARKGSFSFFLKSIWHPSRNLHITNYKIALTLIIGVGIFFGFSHIISAEAWSIGKFAQAAVSGSIIGWVYFRYGLAPAILVHWATNFFIFSYALIISDISQISVESAFSNSFMQATEILLIITGFLSIIILVLNFMNTKKEERLQL